MDTISTFFEDCERGNAVAARNLLGQLELSSLTQKKTLEGRTCFHMAVIAGDRGLLLDLAKRLRDSGLINVIEKADEKGDTALHLAVRKNRVDLMEQLVDLNANLCECANNEGETPLKLAVCLVSRGPVEFLITRTSNALHYIVELNQVKLVEYLIKKKGKVVRAYQSALLPSKKIIQIMKMANLLVKVPGVNKLARNSEEKTPFEIAREVTEYHESFRIIKSKEILT